jgi:hypothetical protein
MFSRTQRLRLREQSTTVVHKVPRLNLYKKAFRARFSRYFPKFTYADILNQSRNFMYKG